MIILVYELDEDDIAIINNKFVGLFNTLQISEDRSFDFRMKGDYIIDIGKTNNTIKIQTVKLKTFIIKEFIETENKKEYLKEKYFEYFI